MHVCVRVRTSRSSEKLGKLSACRCISVYASACIQLSACERRCTSVQVMEAMQESVVAQLCEDQTVNERGSRVQVESKTRWLLLTSQISLGWG